MKADYFISNHRNAFTNSSAIGHETWVYPNADNVTLRYAQAIQDELVKVGVQSNRGVKKGNFHVCRETNMPAILIEHGFISNAKDNLLFDTKLSEYIEAVTKGVCAHAGVTYKSPSIKPTTPVSTPNEDDKLYRVQVDAFKNKANAERLRDKLKSEGYNPIIV